MVQSRWDFATGGLQGLGAVGVSLQRVFFNVLKFPLSTCRSPNPKAWTLDRNQSELCILRLVPIAADVMMDPGCPLEQVDRLRRSTPPPLRLGANLASTLLLLPHPKLTGSSWYPLQVIEVLRSLDQ